ncbi:hypothetical protein [Desulfonatronovibrio magnus]|uniref:hypothetical protein n=1 Tax=Desulfonatronovibrio magnus TaxID=698827 RepID=UPI0005EBD0F8|nr:hypothetical protein [Desulfonatronovibrio magnus]
MHKFFYLLVIIMLLTGCNTMRSSPASDNFQERETFEEDTSDVQPATHRYFDFEDIPIPKGMNLNTKDSILFESQDIKAGMLTFSGRVDSESLFNYLQVAMQNEGWRLLSYIKYGSYIMTFDKGDRLCTMRIIERSFSSELQLWISPKLNASY